MCLHQNQFKIGRNSSVFRSRKEKDNVIIEITLIISKICKIEAFGFCSRKLIRPTPVTHLVIFVQLIPTVRTTTTFFHRMIQMLEMGSLKSLKT